MEESVLLGTKPLVDSIRHFIRDPSGVFSVWHLCECRIVQWRHVSRLLLLLNWFLVSRLFSLHIIKRTLHGGEKIWILSSRGKILFLPLEHKIHIFSPPCNILHLFHIICNNTHIEKTELRTQNVLKQFYQLLNMVSNVCLPFFFALKTLNKSRWIQNLIIWIHLTLLTAFFAHIINIAIFLVNIHDKPPH